MCFLSCVLGRCLVGGKSQFLCIRVWFRCNGRSMVCQAERISFNILIALLLRRLAVLWQPTKRMEPTLL